MSPILEKTAIEELASLIKRLGNPASTVLLNSSCLIFRTPEVDGIIGYQQVKNCAVIIGDPICLPQDISFLIEAFHSYCDKAQLSVVYFIVSDEFAHWLNSHGCPVLIQTGELLNINPTSFRLKQKVRWKVNQSKNRGVIVEESQVFDQTLQNRMKIAYDTWSSTKQGPQMYLESLDLESYDPSRIFYASLDKKIVGALTLRRLDRFQGWVVTIFFALPEAPVGVTEHLMVVTLEALAAENCHFLCLGGACGTQLGEIAGLNMFSRFLAHFIFNTSKRLFQLDSKKGYFNKYHPTHLPTYVVCREKLGISELLALKSILNVSF